MFCSYKAVGIRLDSGDLAYLSVETRKFFHSIEKDFGVVGFGQMNITASNDLNEETIDALNKQVIYIVTTQSDLVMLSYAYFSLVMSLEYIVTFGSLW